MHYPFFMKKMMMMMKSKAKINLSLGVFFFFHFILVRLIKQIKNRNGKRQID